MASTLSPSSNHRIISIILDGPQWYPSYKLTSVHSKWNAVYDLYTDVKPKPPLDYLDSLELALVLEGGVDDDAVHEIFAHGKPLKFWGCPPLLVSKIVEAFRELQEEPSSLDVTITALSGFGAVKPSEAWPEVYTTHLPCYACSTVETVEERRIYRRHIPIRAGPGGRIPRQAPVDPNKPVDFAVEKFHIPSERFRSRLTLALHYEIKQGTAGTDREQSAVLYKITIRLSSEICSIQVGLPATAIRSSATRMLIPDFASEVFGFLDRAHVGSSLLANRDLHDVIRRLEHCLPVHHLTCAFADEVLRSRCVRRHSGAYWLEIRHFRRDLSYTDVRRFKVPSTAGARNDCALIRRYLSNSHVADMLPPYSYVPFSIKMLAGLASRNFSVRRVPLSAGDDLLSDHRSMDIIFGGLRINSICLTCEESCFVELFKTTDFFRTPMIQRLRELKLTVVRIFPLTGVIQPCSVETTEQRRGTEWQHASESPLWLTGVHLMPNCAFYRIDYTPDIHLRSIEHAIVRRCERGKITEIVDRFLLKASGINYAFSRDNLHVAGLKVEGNTYEWDAYRFRNASTNEHLTACVGHYKAALFNKTLLHIAKGEAYPQGRT